MTNSEFIVTIAPIIVQACASKGYKYPSAIIAQACLESNYGRSGLSAKYHNYFGMKCGSSWKGKSVNMKTKEEYTTGTLTTIRDNFRAYDTMQAGVYGYFDFISMRRYTNLKEANSPLDYIERLKKSGWATSSTYVTNVFNVLKSNNLTKYDGGSYTENKEEEKKKSIEEVAKDVLLGKYGNGKERKEKLTAEGYDYNEVQKLVNSTLKSRR